LLKQIIKNFAAMAISAMIQRAVRNTGKKRKKSAKRSLTLSDAFKRGGRANETDRTDAA
jgi:hypothetical protein